MSKFNLDFDELAKIDGIPKDNLTFRINIDDLVVDWDDELGSGSFAQVFRGWYLWTEVAVKKMILPVEEQDMMLIKYFKREVILLNLVKHPNVVQFLGWCHPEDSNYLLIVEEFIKGGTLQKFINKKTARDMWDVKILLCMDVAKAILYLHKNHIVYRDLKCDNILVDDSVRPRYAKLVDFGFARTLEMEQQRKGPPMTICGTDDWMAPEVIMGMDYDERSDVFSFGVVLLECILGTDNVQSKLARKPFNCFQLDTDVARSLAHATCPEELLELTLSCCSYEPIARPDFNEILTVLTNARRRFNESVTGLSDLSADGSPQGSRAADLSQLSPSDDDSSFGTPSANGSRTSDKVLSSLKLDPESEVYPVINVAARAVEGHRSRSGSAADDEADDLRRRVSQHNTSLSRSTIESSPRPVSFLSSRLDTSSENLKSSLNLSGYDSRERIEYIRVESLVDAFTVWNVRIGPGATVAYVCEHLGKKIDAKYKFIELYQLHKRKRVALFPEQFIESIQAHWGGDQEYKFGVMYRTKEGGNDFRPSMKKENSFGKNSPFSKTRKGTLSSTKGSSRDKKTAAMSVNFTMSPS